MNRAISLVAAVAVCAGCTTALAEYRVIDKGTWPRSWPEQLEPLRQNARTYEGPEAPHQHFAIPFARRDEFESAWPYILNVKTKGAPVILVRGPNFFVGDGKAGVVVHSPPIRGAENAVLRAENSARQADSAAAGEAPVKGEGPNKGGPVADEPAVKGGPVAGEGAIAGEGPIEGVDDPRMRWMNTTYIELVVDGQIVDLNRIRLPGDTPIVDERFIAGKEPSSETKLLRRTQAADPPNAKGEPPIAEKDQMKGAQKKGEEQPVPAQPAPPPAKTDRELMVGNWFIMNDDSQRKGEMWVITEDSILMYAKHLGANAYRYLHRLDAGKDPKQIDITVTRVNGPTVGVIKGIYALDEDELRLCLGEMGKDRPAAFPEKPKPGELLVLRRAISGAMPPAAKEKPLAKTDRERMVGNWWIMNDDSQRKGEMWVITEDNILMYANYGGLNAFEYAHRLDESKNPKQIDITISRVNGPAVGVIKGLYALDGDELRLCLGEKDKDRPAVFPEKPKPGEVLVLRRASSGAMPPTAKDAQQEQKVSTPKKPSN